MKKKGRLYQVLGLLLAVGITLGLLFSGCRGQTVPQEKSDDKPLIYTSFYIMYDFASKIAGDRATVVNIMPPGAEVHDWEPTPREVAGLEAADVFVMNGAGLEGWTNRILPALENKDLVVVDTSVGISLLAGDDHDPEDTHEGHSHGEYDPHIWLDPMIAKKQLEKIKDALIQVDPDNSHFYRENYRAYAMACETLDSEYREVISNHPRREFVVAHEAYGYLCKAYGLTQKGVKGYSPDAEPTPYKMAEIIDFIRAEDIQVVLFEDTSSPAVAKAIARETNTQLELLSPIEWLSREQQEAGEDYFSAMRKNLSSLAKALS